MILSGIKNKRKKKQQIRAPKDNDKRFWKIYNTIENDLSPLTYRKV